MRKNDHNVNIEDSDRHRYHHGDLRAAAIRTGIEMLEESGADELGLRALARRIGVSANALYRHFPNKEGLLNALAEAATDKLAAAQAEAAKKSVPGLVGLRAIGVAYVMFAAENPALFRMLFRNSGQKSLLGNQTEDVYPAMLKIRAQVAALLPDSVLPHNRHDATLRSWAIVHGLACLIIDGQVAYDPEEVRRIMNNNVLTEFDP